MTSYAHELRVELDGKMSRNDRDLLLRWIRSRIASDAPEAQALFDPDCRTPTLVLHAPDPDALDLAAQTLHALIGESSATS